MMSANLLAIAGFCCTHFIATVSALADCTFQKCTSCLVEEKDLRNASNLIFEDLPGLLNQTYESPLRLAAPLAYWDSFSVEAQIFGILAREFLNVNISYVNVVDENQAILAIMNCPGWEYYDSTRCEQPPRSLAEAQMLSDADKKFKDPLPDIFVSLEQAPTPSVKRNDLPFDVGALGMNSAYGMYVLPEAAKAAWTSTKLVLESYKAFQTIDSLPFSSTPQRIEAAGVTPFLPGCPNDWNETDLTRSYAINVLQA